MNTQHNTQAPVRRRQSLYGCACLGVGVLGLVTPVLPGIAFVLLGLVLLAPHARWVRVLLARIERHAPETYRAGQRQASRFGVSL